VGLFDKKKKPLGVAYLHCLLHLTLSQSSVSRSHSRVVTNGHVVLSSVFLFVDGFLLARCACACVFACVCMHVRVFVCARGSVAIDASARKFGQAALLVTRSGPGA